MSAKENFLRLAKAAKRNKLIALEQRLLRAAEEGMLDYPEYPDDIDCLIRDRAIRCGVHLWAQAINAKRIAEDIELSPNMVELINDFLKGMKYRIVKK